MLLNTACTVTTDWTTRPNMLPPEGGGGHESKGQWLCVWASVVGVLHGSCCQWQQRFSRKHELGQLVEGPSVLYRESHDPPVANLSPPPSSLPHSFPLICSLWISLGAAGGGGEMEREEGSGYREGGREGRRGEGPAHTGNE